MENKQLAEKETQIEKALKLASDYGTIDGGHHKMWVIDQIVRALTGTAYDEWVAETEAGEDGSQTYEWDTGISP